MPDGTTFPVISDTFLICYVRSGTRMDEDPVKCSERPFLYWLIAFHRPNQRNMFFTLGPVRDFSRLVSLPLGSF